MDVLASSNESMDQVAHHPSRTNSSDEDDHRQRADDVEAFQHHRV